MAFGLYKPGQGYWVRVMTATLAGAIILVASAWLWSELERAGVFIPKPTAVANLAPPIAGTATPGQTLTLLGEPTTTGSTVTPNEIGTAVVRSADTTNTGGMRLVIEKFQIKPRHEISELRLVGPATGGATVGAKLTGNVQPQDLFDPLYLQAAGVGFLMIVGSVLTYWLVGVREGSAEFLIATDGEMKKVNWSTRKDVVASTWVVILWSVLLAGGLFFVDFLFSQFFKLLGVLQS